MCVHGSGIIFVVDLQDAMKIAIVGVMAVGPATNENHSTSMAKIQMVSTVVLFGVYHHIPSHGRSHPIRLWDGI